MIDSVAGKLIKSLESLAMYNDKGIYWARDSDQQVEETRLSHKKGMTEFIQSIGRDNLSKSCLLILESEEILADSCGTNINNLKKLLKSNQFYSG